MSDARARDRDKKLNEPAFFKAPILSQSSSRLCKNYFASNSLAAMNVTVYRLSLCIKLSGRVELDLSLAKIPRASDRS